MRIRADPDLQHCFKVSKMLSQDYADPNSMYLDGQHWGKGLISRPTCDYVWVGWWSLVRYHLLGIVCITGILEGLVEILGILVIQVVGGQVTSPTKPPSRYNTDSLNLIFTSLFKTDRKEKLSNTKICMILKNQQHTCFLWSTGTSKYTVGTVRYRYKSKKQTFFLLKVSKPCRFIWIRSQLFFYCKWIWK